MRACVILIYNLLQVNKLSFVVVVVVVVGFEVPMAEAIVAVAESSAAEVDRHQQQ